MILKEKVFGSYAVKDLEEAMDFYSRILGLKVIKNAMGILELQTHRNNKILIYPKPDHQAAGFTVLNIPVTDIENVVKELNEKGINFEQYEAPIETDGMGILRNNSKGPDIAWFKDPSGNIISLIQET